MRRAAQLLGAPLLSQRNVRPRALARLGAFVMGVVVIDVVLVVPHCSYADGRRSGRRAHTDRMRQLDG